MRAKIGMRCIDPATLVETMFSWGPDFIAPVEFLPNMFGYENGMRGLARELEWQNKTPNLFASIVAIQILGQYSLTKNVSIFALSRADGHVREATPDEARLDFAEFGEQVMGEEYKGASNGQATVLFMGTEYLYTGPPRLERFIHTLRVASENKPGKETLQEIMTEIDEALEPVKPGHIRAIPDRGYTLIIADKGRVLIGGFKNIEQFNLEKLQFLGRLEMKSGKLLFFPEGNQNKSVDFSECIYRS